jgi:glucose/arabinose dehydrogenase
MKRWLALVILVFVLGATIVAYFNKNHFVNRSTGQVNSDIKIYPGAVPGIPFVLPAEFAIHIFANNLGNPRDLQLSKGGTLLVSSPNRGIVYALPDKNNDGIGDENVTVVSGENHPHGLAFYSNKLYVADVDKIVSFDWDEKNLKATGRKVLFSLPQNINHNSRTIIFDSKGTMYVSVGSTCNVCDETSNFSGTIIVSDSQGNSPAIFAMGLRNAPFMQFNPATNELWATEMGRDYLGDNLPPDEINIIKSNNNYGWPNCYGNKIPDTNFNFSATCQNTVAPIYEIPAHSAPLGLVFINSTQFPNDWQGDLLVAYHGSWNRSVPTGYKVIHFKVNGGIITDPEDFLTGFMSPDANGINQVLGRPVDLIFDSSGNLYLSDDKSGNIYKIGK